MFAIAFILAVIVIYDATGVRHEAGEHAKMLNIIVDELNIDREKLKEKVKEKDNYEHEDEAIPGKPFKEFLGHTPLEVLGGALVGIMTAMLIPM